MVAPRENLWSYHGLTLVVVRVMDLRGHHHTNPSLRTKNIPLWAPLFAVGPFPCLDPSISGMNCNYCGDPADTRDHLTPVSAQTYHQPNHNSRHSRRFGETVPCCRECNTLLGSRVFPSVEQRSKYVAKALARRYQRLLKAPRWDAEDVEELGPSLRAAVEASEAQKRAVVERIAHANSL